MGNIKFTADTHFGHQRVAEIRGFASTGVHDAVVLESLRTAVGEDDVLYIVGDNSIEGSYERGLQLLSTLPCKLRLIIGNHDRVFPDKRDNHKYWADYLAVFESIQMHERRKWNGQEFLISHFPYWPNDRHAARFEQWRLPNLGKPLVHGHTHGDVVHEFPNHFQVGWDAWQRPVDLNEIGAWLMLDQHARNVID